MKITPRNELDKISFSLIAIDALLFLFLGFVLFFGAPMFIFVFFHAGQRGRQVETSEAEMDILSKIYYGKDGFQAIWIITGIFFGIVFSVLMTLRKINKSHLVSIELIDNRMLLGYLSINGKASTKEIILTANCLKFNFKKSTDDADANIEIIERQSGKRILSTSKSKYWEFKYDSQKLHKLYDCLKEMKFVN